MPRLPLSPPKSTSFQEAILDALFTLYVPLETRRRPGKAR